MLARGLESSLASRDGEEQGQVRKEGTYCMWGGGRDIRLPFDMQRQTGSLGEPRGELRCCPLTCCSEATCSLKGSSSELRHDKVYGEGTRCMGGGTSAYLLMGNVRRE